MLNYRNIIDTITVQLIERCGHNAEENSYTLESEHHYIVILETSICVGFYNGEVKGDEPADGVFMIKMFENSDLENDGVIMLNGVSYHDELFAEVKERIKANFGIAYGTFHASRDGELSSELEVRIINHVLKTFR